MAVDWGVPVSGCVVAVGVAGVVGIGLAVPENTAVDEPGRQVPETGMPSCPVAMLGLRGSCAGKTFDLRGMEIG